MSWIRNSLAYRFVRKILFGFSSYFHWIIERHATLIVPYIWGNIWRLKKSIVEGDHFFELKKRLYFAYLEHYGAWIGLGAKIMEDPILPHDLFGIFISNNAVIGKRCVIMHQVTIGSNTSIGSKNNGSPTIEDDVFIGAGAKIIGNVIVGEHSRIGANCVVVKDTPPNSVTIIKGVESIIRTEQLDNNWVGVVYEKSKGNA